jgi:hypothetical protein
LIFSRIAAAPWARRGLIASSDVSGKRTGATRDTAMLKNIKSYIARSNKLVDHNEATYLMKEAYMLEGQACGEGYGENTVPLVVKR